MDGSDGYQKNLESCGRKVSLPGCSNPPAGVLGGDATSACKLQPPHLRDLPAAPVGLGAQRRHIARNPNLTNLPAPYQVIRAHTPQLSQRSKGK